MKQEYWRKLEKQGVKNKILEETENTRETEGKILKIHQTTGETGKLEETKETGDKKYKIH